MTTPILQVSKVRVKAPRLPNLQIKNQDLQVVDLQTSIFLKISSVPKSTNLGIGKEGGKRKRRRKEDGCRSEGERE